MDGKGEEVLPLHIGDRMGPENEESVLAGNPEPQRRYRVMADYQAAYPDPFSVSVGETFQVSEKSAMP